jgi:hypothetical protein
MTSVTGQIFNYAAGFGYQATVDFFKTIENDRWEKFAAFLDQFAAECVEAAHPNERASAVSPLMCAAMHGRVKMAAALLDRAAAIDRQEGKMTALQIAARSRRPDVAGLLLERGADVNFRGRQRQTPLMQTVEDGSFNEGRDAAPIARLLLSHGADPNLCDNFGRTVMMMAAEKGKTELCLLLFNASADMDLRDPEGRTAIDCARNFGQEKTAAALEEAVRSRDEAIQENAGVNLAAAAIKGVAQSATVMKRIRLAPRLAQG